MPATIQAPSKATPSSRAGIALFAIALAAVALGVWLWSGSITSAENSAKGSGAVTSSLHLEPFVLNLADRDQRSYLRVGIDLGLGRELSKGESAPVAQARDTILFVLAQSHVEELLTAPGKTKLKDDLLRALQERVPALEVREVYFTEFLIQR